MRYADKKSIEEFDQLRIADDAYKAVDALESVITAAKVGALVPSVLKNKMDKVLHCVEHIEKFAK